MTSKGDQQISRKQRGKIVIYPIYYFLNVTGMPSSFPLIYGMGEKGLRVLRNKESECLTDMRESTRIGATLFQRR